MGDSGGLSREDKSGNETCLIQSKAQVVPNYCNK